MVYVTDSTQNRVQVFTLDGVFVGKWGSTGTGAYQSNNLSGITHDAAGNIYLSDAGNDRVLVYSYATPVATGDTTGPVVTLSSPNNNAIVPAAPVTIRGGATDAVGVGKVETAFQDKVTKKWWNSKNAVWQTAKAWNISALVGANATSFSWSSVLVGGRRGIGYLTQVRAYDTSGNVSTVKSLNITIST